MVRQYDFAVLSLGFCQCNKISLVPAPCERYSTVEGRDPSTRPLKDKVRGSHQYMELWTTLIMHRRGLGVAKKQKAIQELACLQSILV